MAYRTFVAGSAPKLPHSPNTRVLHVAWKPGEEEVLAGATSKGGKMWNMKDEGTEVVEFGKGIDMKWVAWSRDGNLLATVGEEKVIWNSVGMRVSTLQMGPPPPRPQEFRPPVFNKNGRLVILSKLRRGTQEEAGIYVFNALTGACLQSINFDWITPIVWKNETEFFCGGGLNRINLYKVGEEMPLQVLMDDYNHDNFAITFSLAYNEETGILASAARKTVRLWAPAMSILTDHTSIVMEMVWHPHDIEILATIQRDGDVTIWDTCSKTIVHICGSTGPDRFCFSPEILFSPDGRFLAARCENVRILRVRSGDIAAVCKVDGAAVSWSPRGDKLAVHSARVFDLENIVGINLKVLSMMCVANSLKRKVKNQEEDDKKIIQKLEIPEELLKELSTYLNYNESTMHGILVTGCPNHDLVFRCISQNIDDVGLHKDQLFAQIEAKERDGNVSGFS